MRVPAEACGAIHVGAQTKQSAWEPWLWLALPCKCMQLPPVASQLSQTCLVLPAKHHRLHARADVDSCWCQELLALWLAALLPDNFGNISLAGRLRL